eukprot:UN28649
MFWFILMIFVAVTCFTCVFHVLLSKQDEFSDMRKSFLQVFTISIIGEVDIGILDGGGFWMSKLKKCMFVIMVVAVMIIMLNALIAWMTDSYAKVKQNCLAAERKERVGLIIETVEALDSKSLEDIEQSMNWLHVLKPFGVEWLEDDENKNSGKSTYSMDNKKVQDLYAPVGDDTESVSEGLSQNNDHEWMENRVQSLENKLDAMLESMNRLTFRLEQQNRESGEEML